MLRGVTYTRVSTDEQAENGTSLEGQKEALTLLAQHMGIEIIRHIAEPGISGAKFEARLGMQAALNLIEAKEANCLLVYNISRLSRDREHQSIIKRRVEAAGDKLIFAEMNFDDTPEGDLAFGIMGNFAHYERQVIRKRTMGGRRRKAEEGKQPMRSRSPYGYHIVNSKDVLKGLYPAEQAGKYFITEETASVMRQIFNRYAGGMSLRSLCMWLDEQGIPTPRGARIWEEQTIKILLQNPVYKGMGVFGMRETMHDETLITQRGWKRDEYYRIRDESDWVKFEVPPIVDEATWQACQERLSENKQRMSGNPKRKFLLSSLITCPVCGWKMAGANKKGYKRKDGSYNVNKYYICHPKRNGCPEKNYPVEKIEQYVIDALLETAKRPDWIEDALLAEDDHKKALSEESPETICARLNAELDKLAEEEMHVGSAKVDSIKRGHSIEVFNTMLDDLTERKRGLQARLQALRPQIKQKEQATPRETAERITSLISQIEKVLTESELLTPGERQPILATIVNKVTPTEDGAEIQLRGETLKMI